MAVAAEARRIFRDRIVGGAAAQAFDEALLKALKTHLGHHGEPGGYCQQHRLPAGDALHADYILPCTDAIRAHAAMWQDHQVVTAPRTAVCIQG
jgi:hypothetical protein